MTRISRVLVAPLNYSHRQRGQVEAFQAIFGGDSVSEFDWYAVVKKGGNPAAALRDHARSWKPDWIWLQVQDSQEFSAFHIRQLRAELPQCFITHWMGDCRATVSPHLSELCQATHATLLSNAGQHGMYYNAGAARVHYVQIGLDPEDLPGAPDWVPPFRVPDVVFIGNYYPHVAQFEEGTDLRRRAIQALLARDFDVGIVGSGWPAGMPVVGACHVKHQVHVYKRAKVALSINHFNRIPRYYSDRHLIAMASGTPVAAKYVPDLELEFTHGEELLWWRDIDELAAAVTHLMTSDGKAIGRMGQHRALADHSWYTRISELRPLVEEWRRQECKV